MPGKSSITKRLSFRVSNDFAVDLAHLAQQVNVERSSLFRQWIEAGYKAEKARLASSQAKTPSN